VRTHCASIDGTLRSVCNEGSAIATAVGPNQEVGCARDDDTERGTITFQPYARGSHRPDHKRALGGGNLEALSSWVRAHCAGDQAVGFVTMKKMNYDDYGKDPAPFRDLPIFVGVHAGRLRRGQLVGATPASTS
jgi:hypothetical protein